MARGYKVWKKLKKALGRINVRRLLVYTLFLVLALVFWFVRAFQDRYTVEIVYKISTPKIPADISLSEPFPEKIRVRVSDLGNTILGYMLTKGQKELELPLTFSEDRYGEISFSRDQLETLVQSTLLASSSKIEKLVPSSINISYNPKAKKQLPITMATKISPEVGSIVDSIVMSHESVIAYGGKQVLDTLETILTDTLKFSNIKDSTLLNVKLLADEGIVLTPSEIILKVYTQKLVQKVMDIPIEVKDESFPYRILTFPSTIRVSCFIPSSHLEELQPEDVILTLDYSDLESSTNGKVGVVVQTRPDYVNIIQTDPSSVEFILEEKK